MYTPRYNEEKDWETVAAFIRQHGFGLLISISDGLPVGTHLPIELVEKNPGEFVLHGHIANANDQVSTFVTGQTFMVVFMDPHAYISSSWYKKEKIPTWNYIAVHVYGTLRVMDEAELVLSLQQLMNRYEANSSHPVHVHDIPSQEFRNNLKAITGFEISISRVDTRFKLSQNRNDHDYFSVVDHLKDLGDDHSLRIAAEMELRRERRK
ncbi:FMN-binding negative transcriptional regulator [Chitinophaga sp. SYP-B3965]|uniref:FMN-binding negative transcriptional regulator n=1 Tax=Chitinophaga sp. SYP-B3965 TaxID=2663120 RepID=UPI0015636AA0|nr:FMN-binding negative transcriptional regulator [Chitinophaga sp. SYP-B3965]